MGEQKRKAGRPREIEKRTTLSISPGISGWLEFRGRAHSRGVSGYLNQLAEADRDKVLEEDPETAERYRMFCEALGYEGELKSIGL